MSGPTRSVAPDEARESPGWARAALRGLARGHGADGAILRLWDGFQVAPASPCGTLTFESVGALKRVLFRREFGLAEGYVDGSVTWEGDLLGALMAANRRAAESGAMAGGRRRRLQAHLRRILPDAAVANARSHYDLGNAFFSSWLDPNMVYTCAYFESPSVGLAEAQEAKMELICRKLGVGPGDRVIEAGSGWGGLALYMAEHHGAKVRAFNVSAAQIDYARAEAQRRGLSGRVEFIQEDYRAMSGRADVFVSVGMLETVGPRHYAEFGRLIDDVLETSGRGLVHSIGRRRPYPTDAWIERRIFPGSYYPSLAELLRVFEPNDFTVVDVENLRDHYRRTLACWLKRFEAEASAIERDYGARFVRSWRLYLTAAQAAFATHWLELFQLVFTKSGAAAPLWSRPGPPRNS